MVTISLCMIVKNEEETLGKCLESVCDIVDEIIIVDTGSTDKTKEIAKGFTSKIYDFEWIDDFSAARNYSFSKATMDYIFWLDADDVLLEEDRQKFKRLKETLEPEVDVVMMRYNYAFDEHGNVTLTHLRERLSKRSKNFKWKDPIHEYLEFNGKVITEEINITHKRVHNATGRNLRVFERMVAEGKTFSPRNLFYYAKELYYNARYKDATEYFNKFLDSEKGWLEDNINACYTLARCYKALKDGKNTLRALFKSLEYDTPRAEICCELGGYYMDIKDYKKAIFWYELATKLNRPEGSWGFILSDCWGYLPYIQLCVCHYRIGNIDESIRYNERAGEYKPNDKSVLQNRDFFKGLAQESKNNV
ncbi:MAG: glycosyltransferase [Clostridia bacterium]|nr:glycosyltransferase [Clostridia bacterium]